MGTQLTSDDFKESLNTHVAAKGEQIREQYGPDIGWNGLLKILGDRSLVRYPCEVVFAAEPLLEGEFACAQANTGNPQDGYRIFVHPLFSLQLSRVPGLVLYQLVRVNYGEFASADDAETFGANALGVAKDDYYQALCAAADEIGGID